MMMGFSNSNFFAKINDVSQNGEYQYMVYFQSIDKLNPGQQRNKTIKPENYC